VEMPRSAKQAVMPLGDELTVASARLVTVFHSSLISKVNKSFTFNGLSPLACSDSKFIPKQ
jgi:hypothetical protein